MIRGTADGMVAGTVVGMIPGFTARPAIGATVHPSVSAGVGVVSMPATGDIITIIIITMLHRIDIILQG